MFLSADLFKKSVELARNGLLDEIEFEDNGMVMNMVSCQQFDGSGNLRVDKNLKPIKPKPLFLSKMSPPFRLRPTSMYEAQFALKFKEILPLGIRAIVEPSNRAVDAGLVIRSQRLDGSGDGLINAVIFSFRPLEIDSMFPLAVLRFIKVNTTPKKKKEDNGEG